MKMKSKLAAVCAGLMLAAGSANAGCVKGALAGGVVGHVAGKHGVVGAAVGCAIGHHSDKKKQKEAERQAALISVRAEVGSMAIDLASKVVSESLKDSATASRVVDEFLKDIESSKAGN